jgi:FO synthase
VLAIARAGQAAGCREALFTLGDKPELRWDEAKHALAALGHATTIDYLVAMCEAVLKETGLLPHANPGVVSREELARLRRVSVSHGLMLESASARLCEPGGPHHGSPDLQLLLAGQPGVMAVIRRGDRRRRGRRDNVRRRQLQRKEKMNILQ